MYDEEDRLRRYLLKEYGSWGVMLISFLTGLLVTGKIGARSLIAIAALSLYVNSKQALTLWMRGGKSQTLVPMTLFFGQAVLATALLISLLGGAIVRFLPFAIAPLVYIFLMRFAGEHAIISEISGFTLLTLSSLISKYAASGDLDPRLYAAVAVFFTAGVFRVKVQLRKGNLERIAMGLYVVFALITYAVIRVRFIVLLPLMDDVIFAATLYKVKLRVTGWIELVKGIAFLFLMTLAY
jgi:hypothetical protein